MARRIEDVLARAIAAERGAIEKYTTWADVALTEGYPNVARVFAALVRAETVHVENHQRARGRTMNTITSNSHVQVEGKRTLDNVLDAMSGEKEEYKVMYPRFIKELGRASTMEDKVARLSLEWARHAEQQHAALLDVAARALAAGEDLPPGRVYFCIACGTLHYGEPPSEICPVCKHDPGFYKEVA